MIRRPPRSTRTDTLFPYTTLFRSLDLCKALDVSSVTIRKDLKLLEDKNLLFRTHGGATLNNPYMTDRPVNEKEKLQSAEKMCIGAAAAKLIQPNDSIVIASGTTVLALAKALQTRESLTVITSALNVALELLRHKDIEILKLGGVVRKSSTSVVGPYSEHILDDFFCSTFFLRSEEHTSELQSLIRISYAVFCL